MKFAHLADCHIGSWRDPKLRDTSTLAFSKAVDKCIKEEVDFILIAGDLFNTSFPRLDNLKAVVMKFKQLKDLSIPVYIVPGSHDYSPSGKTILDVLEEAGLFVNVFKGNVENGKLKLNFTIDNKTGAKIAGILGKRGALEKAYYERLMIENLEKEDGNVRWEPIQIYNIFKINKDCNHKIPEQIKNEILDEIKNKEFNNTVVLIRFHGTLESGKPSDIDFKEIFTYLYDKSAYFVMKSSHAVVSKEFEEIKTDARNVEDIESFLIKEHLGQIKLENLSLEKEEEFIKNLMRILITEKQEGETVPDFERRVREEVSKIGRAH